jgi:membrane-associated phospholipid phosphatase
MTPFEWIALAYFILMPLAAARSARPSGWRYALGAILLVIVARFGASREARAWLPHAYLVLGYWIPAAFTPGINHAFERWLARTDVRLGSSRPSPSQAGRRYTHHGFELAYLLCYPLVPAAFTVVFIAGNPDDITRFWVAVLLAGYACYGSLPWTAARPPRMLSAPEPIFFARINAQVLGLVSHRMNTFPSGHVAVALAAALAVCSVSMAWGLGFLVVATGVAVAAVKGRYHYLVDVLVGAGVGLAAFATAAVAVRAGSGPGPA